jgi:hypothetical protein
MEQPSGDSSISGSTVRMSILITLMPAKWASGHKITQKFSNFAPGIDKNYYGQSH